MFGAIASRPANSVVSEPTSSPNTVQIEDRSRWFAEEVQLHEGALRNYLRGRVPSASDVDDVIQESYLKILKAKPGKGIASIRAYLFTVARNTAFKLFRKEKIFSPVRVADLPSSWVVDEEQNVTHTANLRSQDALIAEAIARLPPRRRDMLLLRVADGLAPGEIAARLGVSESTVRTQLTRALGQCAHHLRQRGVTADT